MKNSRASHGKRVSGSFSKITYGGIFGAAAVLGLQHLTGETSGETLRPKNPVEIQAPRNTKKETIAKIGGVASSEKMALDEYLSSLDRNKRIGDEVTELADRFIRSTKPGGTFHNKVTIAPYRPDGESEFFAHWVTVSVVNSSDDIQPGQVLPNAVVWRGSDGQIDLTKGVSSFSIEAFTEPEKESISFDNSEGGWSAYSYKIVGDNIEPSEYPESAGQAQDYDAAALSRLATLADIAGI